MATKPLVTLASQQAFDQTGADVDAKELGEAEIGDDGHHKADGRVAQNIAAAEAVRDQHEHGGGGGGETERHDQDHVDDEPGGDEAECAPVDRDLSLLLRLPAAARSLDDQKNGEQREARRGNGGKYRRSDLGIERRHRNLDCRPKHPYGEGEQSETDQSFGQAPPRAPRAGHVHVSFKLFAVCFRVYYSPGLMPASLITSAHLARSVLMVAASSPGEPPTASRPSWANLARISGSATIFVAS